MHYKNDENFPNDGIKEQEERAMGNCINNKYGNRLRINFSELSDYPAIQIIV